MTIIIISDILQCVALLPVIPPTYKKGTPESDDFRHGEVFSIRSEYQTKKANK